MSGFLAAHHRVIRNAGFLGDPGIEIVLADHFNRPLHRGMLQAAQFGAAHFEIAQLGGGDAQVAHKLISAGQRILFDAKFGHPEGMDHVGRRQVQDSLFVFGHIQGICHDAILGIFKPPGPLLADNIDLQRFWIGAQGIGQGLAAQDGKHHNRSQGGNGPGYFQSGVSFNVAGIGGVAFLAAEDNHAV